MMEIKETIGKKIRQARMARGWKQKQLAAELNLTAQNISDYERGKAKPPSDVVLRLANLFDKPTDWFYGKTVVADPFERLETLLHKYLVVQEEEEPQEEEMSHLEQADPRHETFPWAYNFRSQVILWKWQEKLQARGYHLNPIVPPRPGHAFLIEPSSKANTISGNYSRHLILEPDEGFSLRESCLYMLPSPFKHELLWELFEEFFKRFKTTFFVGEKKDFYFGYETNTVEIAFDGKVYTPSYESKGHGRSHFVDYASLIYAAFPKMPKRKIGKFDSILAFGGCHRLGTGGVAYLASHPKILQVLLDSTEIVPFEDSFEAVFRIETTTGVPLTEDAISFIDASKIDDDQLTVPDTMDFVYE